MATTYDKEKDYTSEINKAVASGDYKLAGQLEDQRNAKIADEGLDYEQTHNYTGNNDASDYAAVIKNQISSGVNPSDVAETLAARNNKISTAKNLSKYANDDVTQAALEYIKNGYTANGDDFSYQRAPTYTGKYDDQIAGIVDKILNGTYADFLSGNDYSALSNKYTASGKTAMDNTIGQVSARTGGLASSYATTAANETYNDYMSKLDEAAREMYGDEKSSLYDKASLLSGLDNSDYSKYEGMLGQYNTDRNFAYNQNRDKVADSEYSQEYADSRSDTAYSEKQDAYSNLSALISATGYTPTEEELTAAGMSSAAAAALRKQYIVDNAKSTKSTKSTKSSSGSSGSEDYDGLFAAAEASGYPENYIANNYKKFGFTSSSGLVDNYYTWDGGDSGDNSASSYNSNLNKIAAANSDSTSSTYNAVSREMLNQRRSGTSDDDMADYLSNLVDKGTITEAQAYQLAKQYGLLTNSELGLS